MPLTVTDGYVKVPTFEFTVASVPAAVTFPLPSKLGEVYARSPVIDMVRPVASLVAVPALPLILPVMRLVKVFAAPLKVFESPRSVDEAAPVSDVR